MILYANKEDKKNNAIKKPLIYSLSMNNTTLINTMKKQIKIERIDLLIIAINVIILLPYKYKTYYCNNQIY